MLAVVQSAATFMRLYCLQVKYGLVHVAADCTSVRISPGQRGAGALTYRVDVQASHFCLQLVVRNLLQLAALNLQICHVALPSCHQ